LALALALDGHENIYALGADTDGQDGTDPVAGAFVGPETLSTATDKGMDAQGLLDQNRSHNLFESLNDHLITGPTQTNVNDFRLILIHPK
jgi:glycerate 2-kinase